MKKQNKKSSGAWKTLLIAFGVLMGTSVVVSVVDGIHQVINPEYKLEVEQKKAEQEKLEQEKLVQQEIDKKEKEAQQRENDKIKAEQEKIKALEKAEADKIKKMENALGVDVKSGDTYEFVVDKLNLDDEKNSLIVTINHSENTYVFFDEVTFESDIRDTIKWVRDESEYNIDEYQKIKIIINVKVYNKYGELLDAQLVNYKITPESLNKIKFDTFLRDNLGVVGELNINKMINFQ